VRLHSGQPSDFVVLARGVCCAPPLHFDRSQSERVEEPLPAGSRQQPLEEASVKGFYKPNLVCTDNTIQKLCLKLLIMLCTTLLYYWEQTVLSAFMLLKSSTP
jgi:hypothetical protein